RDGGVVEGHLAAGIALVVLALLDVIALYEAEVLERASPCVPDRHLRLRFGLTEVIPPAGCFPIMQAPCRAHAFSPREPSRGAQSWRPPRRRPPSPGSYPS